ncbi:GlsB/YeaQ/YmgE family stress response membrane protein [Rubinisphaera margarita]|uniref:GlsB/YeaQ/YmgE family stress response membrane protein n=1 Tax=Rubinisphaera margarita TaxID=2909586 RepID=UPI001EE91B95|nr:GlsB/YeaQ/YmgE family stress response membrane protein [Rubinisphaera margarita]MCG6158564.1 GlsB/YeaQ/YmgE family stress response membrane protein [Rubinisphaera margarita]
MDLLVAIVVWSMFGLVVGAIARLLVPGRQPMGLLATILLGVAGSFLGGFGYYLFMGRGDLLQPSSFIASLIGAVILVLLSSRGRRSAWR